MSAKAESENTRLNFGNIPKGVFFEITGIQLIISTKFDKESYVATIGDVFSVFLPARYVNDRVMKFKVFFTCHEYLYLYLHVLSFFVSDLHPSSNRLRRSNF